MKARLKENIGKPFSLNFFLKLRMNNAPSTAKYLTRLALNLVTQLFKNLNLIKNK
jgi:hypothetical protein